MNTDSNQRRIKDMVASERPQERLERLGVTALSDRELLAMILRSGPPGVDVVSMCDELLHKAGSLHRLCQFTAPDFESIRGIGKVKALQLIAVMDFAKRVLAEDYDVAVVFTDACDVARHLRPVVAGAEVERFWTLCLDRKNRLIQRVEVSKGSATSCLAHPREVFRDAIKAGAAAIIVAHNHPSGDPAPSAADIRITKQLKESSAVVGIDLIDHVVVGQAPHDPKGVGHYSFSDGGLL